MMIKFSVKIILFLIPIVLFSKKTFPQSESKILLIAVNTTKCSSKGLNDTKTFIRILNHSLWGTKIFKDTLSYTEYKQALRWGNFAEIIKKKKVSYYLSSVLNEVNASSGKTSYSIDFFLYDINSPNNLAIENQNFKFEIDLTALNASINRIERVLKSEIEYFNENGGKFRQLIKVEPFTTADPDDSTRHTKVFPKWMVDKLNDDRLTNREYTFKYEDHELNKDLVNSYIEGNLKLYTGKDSIKIKFWINIDTSKNSADIIIYKDYKIEDEKNKDIIIKTVFEILKKMN